MASSKADSFGFYPRRGSRFWWTVDPVTRKAVSTRCADLGAAKLWRQAREQIAANPAIAAAALSTLGDECRLMLDALKAAGRSTKYYEQKLGHWTRILGNDCALAELGPDAFDRFIAARRAEGVTNHTVSKELKCMVTTLRQAKRSGRWAGDLATLRPLGFSAGYVPRTRALTLLELRALLAALPPEAQAFVALCVATGLRLGEALKLRPEHVDLALGVVHVHGTKTKGARRDLPILDAFRPLVELAARHLPFSSWARSGHYTTRFEVACRRAGIERCTPNDLRRTHATLLRNAGVDAKTARALLGHTAGSQLLETVYDKPRPHELAARAGDLTAISAEVASLAESLQHPSVTPGFDGKSADFNRPWGPVYYPAAEGRQALSQAEGAETGSEGTGEAAESLQSVPGAWALALAAEGVLARRVHLVAGTIRRRKAKRDAG